MLALLKGLRREPDAPERERLRVLVVEDEAVMQRFYACFFDQLHAAEFSWSLARDGGEALKALEDSPPDVVLLDWMLPSVPGPAVLRAIRAHPKTRGLGVLVVTAKSGPGDAALALEDGADDFLSKPFDERVLLARLHSLQRRHQALAAVEERLKRSQRLETLGLLAGGIVHDFNNMLTAIRGLAELIMEGPASGPSARADVGEIHKAADHAAALTRQLLEFSRPNSDEPESCDVNRMVESLAQMLRRLIPEDISIELSLAPGLPPVRATPCQAAQMLVNLAVNARDAMPAGGTLRIETAAAGEGVRLSVTDTGAGMGEGTLKRLFDPFFTTKGCGSGLGLATVRDIVRRQGGDIDVSSEPGRGSRFVVVLPHAQAPLPAAAAEPGPPTPGQGETVLVVEDDAAVRGVTCRMLRGDGYRILEAAGGEEAARRLEEVGERVDLLVTDVVLPGESGPELAKRLAARVPGLKVLFLSGYMDETLARHGLADGEAALLGKPFTHETLAKKVREVLGGRSDGEA